MNSKIESLAIAYPLPTADSVYWEFFRNATEHQNLIVGHYSVGAFTAAETRASIPGMIAALKPGQDQGARMLRVTGVPVLAPLGPGGVGDMCDTVSQALGAKVGTDIDDAAQMLHEFGSGQVVLVSKWEPGLFQQVLDYYRASDINIVGRSQADWNPESLRKIEPTNGITLGKELIESALVDYPDATAVYLGGGAWRSSAIIDAVAGRISLPIVTNLGSVFSLFRATATRTTDSRMPGAAS